MKVGDIVEVTWDDHSFDFGELGRPKIVGMTTVGFLAFEDEEKVCVALTRREDGEYAEVQTIDRRMLHRVKRLVGR